MKLGKPLYILTVLGCFLTGRLAVKTLDPLMVVAFGFNLLLFTVSSFLAYREGVEEFEAEEA